MSAGKVLGEALAAAWMTLRPFSEEARTRRQTNKALRRARKGKSLTPEQEQLLAKYNGQLPETEVSMLTGSKSWIGLVTIGVGLLVRVMGWGNCSPEEVAAATCVPADTLIAMLSSAAGEILTAIGTVITAVGVEHKRRRERKLKAAIESQASPAA